MFDIAVWIAVGAVVGWNIPQPFWSVFIQTRVVEWLKSFKK